MKEYTFEMFDLRREIDYTVTVDEQGAMSFHIDESHSDGQTDADEDTTRKYDEFITYFLNHFARYHIERVEAGLYGDTMTIDISFNGEGYTVNDITPPSFYADIMQRHKVNKYHLGLSLKSLYESDGDEEGNFFIEVFL